MSDKKIISVEVNDNVNNLGMTLIICVSVLILFGQIVSCNHEDDRLDHAFRLEMAKIDKEASKKIEEKKIVKPPEFRN